MHGGVATPIEKAEVFTPRLLKLFGKGSNLREFSSDGCEFNPDGLAGIAEPTQENFVKRINQLYERGATLARIGENARGWLSWVRSGLD